MLFVFSTTRYLPVLIIFSFSLNSVILSNEGFLVSYLYCGNIPVRVSMSSLSRCFHHLVINTADTVLADQVKLSLHFSANKPDLKDNNTLVYCMASHYFLKLMLSE